MQRLQFNIAFPRDIQIPVKILGKLDGPQRGIYEWELAQLAKELIINAPVIGSTDFRTWSTFSDAVNRFKRLDNDISGHYEELFRKNILVEMYRHAHHQFGWQDTSIIRSVSRYLKILSHPDLDAIVRAEMGFDARALYTIGLSVAGHFLSSPELDVPITLSLRSVTPEQVTSFFSRFSVDIGRMRELCIEGAKGI